MSNTHIQILFFLIFRVWQLQLNELLVIMVQLLIKGYDDAIR